MAIERCDKCGKPFMTKSELERHKMWEHPVPVSPFEERLAAATKGNTAGDNRGDSLEDLHKLTSDVAIGGENNSSDTTSSTTIGGGYGRKVPFRPFRL